MAADVYVVTAEGADIGVGDPGAAPPSSLHSIISDARVIIHDASLIHIQMAMVVVLRAGKALAEVEARKLGQGRRERRFRFLGDG